MPLVIKDGNMKIGAYRVVGRKLPQLCIENDNQLEFYGEFNSDDKARAFMRELAEFMGAKVPKSD